MDPANMMSALARQEAALAPISRGLSAAAVFPPRVGVDEWRGESAAACERLEERLRDQLRAADEAVGAAQRLTRIALAELAGVG
jgi:hypothetical protein